MVFPYERYEKLAAPTTIYYPAGEEARARWVFGHIDKAGRLLAELLALPIPELQVLVAAPQDWPLVPGDESEQTSARYPYFTDTTSPASVVIPTQPDTSFGEMTDEKLAFILYHELALAFLEADPRPWPTEYPLWADEWQLKFAALWLSQLIDGQQGVVNKDLFEQNAEIFEPEADGKTPVTVRGFDWYEGETSEEDYLVYELLLERFARDLLSHSGVEILPAFTARYRVERERLLSDDVTAMLASVLGPGGSDWLEELVYF
jgi:hypothetical protein